MTIAGGGACIFEDADLSSCRGVDKAGANIVVTNDLMSTSCAVD